MPGENQGSLRANAGCYATRRLWGQDCESLYWACDNLRAKRGATMMIFSHPLARSASVFTAKNNDGSEYRVLAIVTTLELDPMSQNYKKPFVEKLSRAARDYLADADEAAAFVLMNRPRDWGAHLSSGGGARRRPGDARKRVEGHSGSF
jgi:hypothetical protein